MEQRGRSLQDLIMENYQKMSATEQVVADFFLNRIAEGIGEDDSDALSAKAVSAGLYVSNAALSRFSKRLGFSGYREFVYFYRREPARGGVFGYYEQVISSMAARLDREQIRRIAEAMRGRTHIFIYGLGSSGISAQEFELRLARDGLAAKSIHDFHQMVINERQLDSGCMVFGISLSGETQEVLTSLKKAGEKGAFTVLLTANRKLAERGVEVDELLLTAAKGKVISGRGISPQIPILLALDLLYEEFLKGIEFDEEEDIRLWNSLKTYPVAGAGGTTKNIGGKDEVQKR